MYTNIFHEQPLVSNYLIGPVNNAHKIITSVTKLYLQF